MASYVTLDTADGPMPAYQALPAEEPARGGVVVVQEAFGVTTHIEAVCDRLAVAGWLAVAPALFHRQGSPVIDYGQFDQVMPLMRELGAGGIDADVDAAFDHLGSAGLAPRRCAVVGFCMGGSVALATAARRPLGAAVTYYGGGLAEGRFGYPPLVDVGGGLQTPWLGHFGDLDKGIPVAEVEALREATAGAPVDAQVCRYAGADHGFNCDDRPAVFDPAASALAWERTLSWLDRHADLP